MQYMRDFRKKYIIKEHFWCLEGDSMNLLEQRETSYFTVILNSFTRKYKEEKPVTITYYIQMFCIIFYLNDFI